MLVCNFHQGAQVPPVVNTGFWSLPEVYPDPLTVYAATCDYRNVRGVCIGYPEVENQTRLQLCRYHPQDEWCGEYSTPGWPNLTGIMACLAAATAETAPYNFVARVLWSFAPMYP